MGESSTKPYLIRALHEWCTDNGYTPYVVVQVNDRTMVPPAHVRDGQITLNIGNLATNKLLLGNEYIEFQARFNGVIEMVSVPVGAVSAIYARETGAGMGFEVQDEDDDTASRPAREGAAAAGDGVSAQGAQGDKADGGKDDDPPPRPRLTIVK
ncbi:ClpXP protease specificity-enhancing factor [Bordetella bronchialis]|uniref:ClpXP protease specificity-enhancing factor n=1 Tax=Bordetella bronchialis TaxID=463025 RepID=A0A193FPU8_9BORD|nr:ClpXP protease specificity-enhancing factor [Bordetella bronchialis]ANN69303.1 ClpXP protease specificity-enhancing factor [Bordetella bronchialis]ANN74450.1 ClpXP protease specificity-enhancing factor [Bordetella bronchialis]